MVRGRDTLPDQLAGVRLFHGLEVIELTELARRRVVPNGSEM